ncbi:homeobox-leucine zipper protein ROC8-like [Typha angustifolia]|uniref:homeobox-leucine zipper protein ROC8-like n=1 Tax=Typha angustifolia TaxID=59011 RepID=UPI003C2F1590
MDFGDDQDGSDGQRKKKRYHRHTPRQIQQLEAMFKECPHPDEKQRMQLSRDLALEPRQIKFWFQNRRTQMKAQHERADNCALRAENDKIRCENIAMREALKNVICPTCGGPPVTEDSYFDEQKLRMENARLKEELDQVSSLTSKYLGRPITQLPPVQPVPISSLDLSVGGLGSPVIGPSLDLDLLTGSSSAIPFPFPTAVSEMEKPIMADMATSAMDEVIRLVQTDEPLWVKPGGDGREVLSLETYDRIFRKPGNHFRGPDIRVEVSRDSGLVFINAVQLVDVFMDSNKWLEFFPSIISKTRTIEVLAAGMSGRSGSLLLMYEELHVLSPVVPTREFCFLRYCQQIEQGLWVIADVSVDLPRENQYSTPSRSRRLPSGCLIQDVPNGYSKVTWVEHMEIEEKAPVHLLYRDLVNSGTAFGAHRWLTTLQRTCERFACLMAAGNSPRDLGGVIPSPEGKRSMMKLSQRMVNNFCVSLSSSQVHRWTTLSGLNDVGVRVTVHRSSGPGQPSGVVLSAATSLWLPISCERVFTFFRDENMRSQWDVLSSGNSVQEVARITNGSHPGNCISLLRGLNSSQNSMLILQESCTDASGSLVVYAPIDIPAINIVMSGEDPSNISLLPSGFAILPDGRSGGGSGASTSSNPMGSSLGSLITVAFQILVSSLPSSKLNVESVATVNNLISTTVQQIKAALNCPSG